MVPVEESAVAIKPTRARLPKAAAIAMRALAEVILESGEAAPASNHVPSGAKVTTLDLWRERAYARGISTSDEPRAKQLAFKRASEHLIEVQAVGVWREAVWIAKQVP